MQSSKQSYSILKIKKTNQPQNLRIQRLFVRDNSSLFLEQRFKPRSSWQQNQWFKPLFYCVSFILSFSTKTLRHLIVNTIQTSKWFNWNYTSEEVSMFLPMECESWDFLFVKQIFFLIVHDLFFAFLLNSQSITSISWVIFIKLFPNTRFINYRIK